MISLQSADDDSDYWLHKDPPVLMTAGVRQKFCYETVDYDV